MSGLSLRLFADQHLDRSSFFVQSVELDRNPPRFLFVRAGQKPHPKVRLSNSAACVDSGPERKSQISARRRLDQTRRLGERDEAAVLPHCHDFEALDNKGAIETFQARDIGDRPERNEIEKIENFWFLRSFEK